MGLVEILVILAGLTIGYVLVARFIEGRKRVRFGEDAQQGTRVLKMMVPRGRPALTGEKLQMTFVRRRRTGMLWLV